MKTSDIPDVELLELLALHQGEWGSHCWGWLGEYFKGYPDKLGLSKMRQLHKRGFVGGCTCGCRGDWEITDVGLAFIGRNRKKEYSGYGERRKK